MESVMERNKKRIWELEQIIREREKSLKKAPEGRLRVSRSENREQYFHLTEKSPRKGKYLGAKDSRIRNSLAQKDYDEKVVAAAKRELKALLACNSAIPEIAPEEIYLNLHRMRKKCVNPIRVPDEEYIRNWEEESFVTKGVENENTEYVTEKGERVRSKSEIIIANKLRSLGIPYRYECELQLSSGRIIYPDFTILHVPTRRTLFYEHFGMMDDPDYVYKNMRRVFWYEDDGIIPGDRLFITWESDACPLNIARVEGIFRKCFM